MKSNSMVQLIINLIIGVVIIFIANIITGHGYSEENMMGSLLVVDYILRVVSTIIGLLVIGYTVRELSEK